MAGGGNKFPVAQGSKTQGGNAISRNRLPKVVFIVFHSNRYRGPCWLYPLDESGKKALPVDVVDGKPRPKDQTFVRAADTLIMGYPTTTIVPDKKVKNRWLCVVREKRLPLGRYLLEVPFKSPVKNGPRSIFHLVEINGKFLARKPYSRKPLGPPSGKPLPKPLMVECLIGDGISLEEALFNVASYRYADSVGVLKSKDWTNAAEGKEPESGFKTCLGVAQSAQENVASLIGVINADFGLYKDLKTLDQYLNKDDRLVKPLLDLWKRTGVAQSKLHWLNDLRKPNVEGVLIHELDEQGKVKRNLRILEGFDQKKVEQWRENLQYNKPLQSLQKWTKFAGSALAFAGNAIDTVNLWLTFKKAEDAGIKFSYVVDNMSGRMRKIIRDEPALAKLWRRRRSGVFCRGDLATLEHVKAHADNLAGKAAVEGWKWVYEMSSIALGYAKVGKVFSNTKLEAAADLYPMVKSAALSLDKRVGSNVYEVKKIELERWWHDIAANANNEATLQNVLFSRTTANDKKVWLKVLFLTRAKVLYGLKRLIDKCGPAVNSRQKRSVISQFNYTREAIDWVLVNKDFREKVRRFRIDKYIRTLCLSPYFYVRKDAMLEDWVHHWLEEEDTEYSDQVIRSSLTTKEFRTGKWFRVNFQEFWPIHFMDHADVHSFARRFSTDWSAINDDDVDRCILLRGSGSWKPVLKTKQYSLSIKKWRLLKDDDVIDSETPIRAALVLKPTAKAKDGIPVQFQLERTDGLNVAGPVYNTVLRRFNGSAPEAKAMKGAGIRDGRYIAMVDLSYAYRDAKDKHKAATIYHGLKPMIETSKWWQWMLPFGFGFYYTGARRLFHSLSANAQSMAVKYTVGDGSVSGYATMKNFWNSTVEVTVRPDRVTAPKDPRDPKFKKFKTRNRKKFTDIQFLQRQVAAAKPPTPIKPQLERVVAQYCPDGVTWKYFTGETLDWNHPLRVVFVFRKKTTWGPCVIRVDRSDHLPDTPGPYYTSNVVTRLDEFGYKGKWGVVITPYYYWIEWQQEPQSYKEPTIKITNNGRYWPAIKPFVGRKRGITDRITSSDYAGCKFEIKYAVGTNDPNKVSDAVPNADDVKLKIHGSWAKKIADIDVGAQIGLVQESMQLPDGDKRSMQSTRMIGLVGGAHRDTALRVLLKKNPNTYNLQTESY